MISRWLQLLGCLILALLLPPTTAKKAKPSISPYKLPDKPYYMFYFEKSDTVLISLEDGNVLRSFDAGKNWEVIEDNGMKYGVISIHQHPFNENKAFALGGYGEHWITTDQAKTWRPFKVPDKQYFKSPQAGPFAFHGRDTSKVIFETRPCPSCTLRSYYTTDDFNTIDVLTESAVGCYWAVGDPQFATDPDVSKGMDERTLCVAPGLKSSSKFAFRLVYSDDYFASQSIEVKLHDGRPVSGVTSIAQVKRFIVAAVESQGTTERALFVTVDTKDWHRAEFGDHKIEEDAYTVLESTDYSLQVDVLTDRFNGMGVLFTSNSDGTYFTRNIEHTNRGRRGYVDFEKLAVIQGIVLVNTVNNPKEVGPGSEKEVVSKISFDDGRTFQSLKVDGQTLHLHSVNSDTNLGRVFSSPAPGLVMGIGNTGDHLGDYYADGNLYISDDAGLNWRLALKGPHKYEFGDQGAVLMAISDKGNIKKIEYSLDHGKEWKSVDLPHEIDTKAYGTTVTTTPDSTSLKFILVGYSKDDFYVYAVDFNDLHERKCEEDDFDPHWPARRDEDGKPDCLMGHKQFFRRRKANADCFVAEAFNSSMSRFEPCKCTIEDYECKYRQTENGTDCVPPKSPTPPEGECKNPTDKFMGPSGWRLIPGDACIRDGGDNPDKNIELPCKDVNDNPTSKEITSTTKTFSSNVDGYYYLERQVTNSGEDETVMMLSSNRELFVSHDHGKKWEQELKDKSIIGIVRHHYNSDTAYVLTNSNGGYYTINRGETFESFDTKLPPTHESAPTLRFHPSKRDWLIWIGADCDSGNLCHSNAYFSSDRGDTWKLMLRYAKKCEFESRENRPDSDYLIFCEQYENENESNRLRLVSTTDESFSSDWNVHFEDLVDYVTRSEYIIVASRNTETGALKASVSVDGVTFADLKFPPSTVAVQDLYTVLDSSEHAIFLYVATGNKTRAEYGSIVKSNSNGTTYVLSLDSVNQDSDGYVDFERMQALEGVLMANIVSNTDELSDGAPKRLRTMITHNDGGEWSLLAPPNNDADGESFACSTMEGAAEGKGTKECALHLHGYTERVDARDTFSSGSAIGLMMGQGNVGSQLTSKEEADTFITQDGGISWKPVKKGRYMWEYGDSGSVIAIVSEGISTKVLHYSTNEGETWQDYEFSQEAMEVLDISTVPSDTSRSFILWGKKSGEPVSVNVDFSGIYDRDCMFDNGEEVSDDYYLWKPKHPSQENDCLFGHIEQYRRKKSSAECWNNWRGPHLHSIESNCTCTTADYECDYNYQRQPDGSCGLVPGLSPQDPMAFCKAHPEAVEFFEVTGYRRIPQTTCENGKNLDHLVPLPCPGKEKEYEQKHGISTVGLFFAIVIPIAVAGAVGYYLYTRWDGKFGQIRLGEASSGNQGLLSRDSLLITVPITIIAGIVALAKTLPLLATSLWRSASGYIRIGRGRNYHRPYASRSSFAARRGDYASVVDDEDELLGVVDIEGDEEEEL